MRTHEKHRDSEKRLFLLAAILVLLSVVFLTGSLIVLAEFPRGEQSYEPGRMYDEGIFTRKEPVEEPGGAPTDAEEFPPSQLEMQEKFGALTVTDEATNAVTVVGEDALHAYWADYDPETEGIRSLTQAEVFYLLADSVRLYETGETLVLPAYDLSARPEKELSTRFSSDRVLTKSDDLRTATESVYDLFLYRLALLSSPDCFVTKDDLDADLTDLRLSDTLLLYCPQEAVGNGRDFLVRELCGLYGSSATCRFDFFALWTAWSKNQVPTVLFCQAPRGNVTRLYPSDETADRLADVSMP